MRKPDDGVTLITSAALERILQGNHLGLSDSCCGSFQYCAGRSTLLNTVFSHWGSTSNSASLIVHVVCLSAVGRTVVTHPLLVTSIAGWMNQHQLYSHDHARSRQKRRATAESATRAATNDANTVRVHPISLTRCTCGEEHLLDGALP